ncbi:MAG: hypothetical protein WKF40_09230 [Thermoleophilaceae bacterium]
MAALLAQGRRHPADGLPAGMFSPLIYGAVLYAVLYVAGAVLANREDPRGETAGDAAFVLLLLLGVYTAVAGDHGLASRFELLVDLLRIMAIVVVFFGLLIVVPVRLRAAVRRDRAVPCVATSASPASVDRCGWTPLVAARATRCPAGA